MHQQWQEKAEERTKTARVANHIGRGDVGDGRVRVVRLTDILVGIGDVAIDDESLEVVVGQSRWQHSCDSQKAGGDSGTHLVWSE